jgi:hypothetical protein
MTSYPSNLVLEDFMVKTGFEFPLTGLSSGDFSSFLASTEDDLGKKLVQQRNVEGGYKVLYWGYGGCVERGVGVVCFEQVKCVGVKDLS